MNRRQSLKALALSAISSEILLAVSCKKNLDPKLYGQLSPINFPKTASDFQSYALEVYKPWTAKWGYQDQAFQDLFYGYEYSNCQMNDGSSDLFAVFPEWGGFYTTFSEADFRFLINQDKTSHFEKLRFITRLTKILGDLETTKVLEEETRALLMAETRMSRGWMMYCLWTMYGPLPVITDPAQIGTSAENDMTRPDESTYLAVALKDLQSAADNLPQSPSEYGRFNKGLALSILMRVYLQQKDYNNAELIGRQIQGMGYGLLSTYRNLFRSATERNTETIYAISCDDVSDGQPDQGNMNAWSYYLYPADFPGITQKGGWASPNGAYTPTWAFYDSFDPKDVRRAMMIPAYTSLSGQPRDRSNLRGPVLMKYPDEDKSTSTLQGNDIPVIRYADILLMLAEAINHNHSGPTPEAVQLVNSVRSRAGIPGLSAGDTASQQAFDTALLRERGWELCFEGQRRVDLMRFGQWENLLSAVTGKIPGPALLPVPQYAVNSGNGKLTQTPGY